jgi:hypothetical protein
VPWSLSAWYANPLATGAAQSVGQSNILFAYPMLSGPSGISIDKLDVYVTAVGTASSTRVGIYKITNQAQPFAWQVGVKYADLLAELGAIPTIATGQQVLTPAAPYAIPANTWFLVAGVDQGTALANRFRWVMGQGSASPLGISFASGYSANTAGAVAVYQTGVSGALPAAFVPAGNYVNYDCGVGVHRSA